MGLLGKSSWALGMLGAVLAGCAADSGGKSLYVMNYQQELEGGIPLDNRPAVSCSIAVFDDATLGGSTSGGGPGPDYQYHAVTHGEGLHVTVSSDSNLLAERFYDEPFILSGEVDHFEVVTRAQKTFRLVHWGGDSCDAFIDED